MNVRRKLKMAQYEIFETGRAPIKAWVKGVPIDEKAKAQLANTASLPFIHEHVAVMPDVHVGKGATIGSVIATDGAIVPAAVGVDLGCGMMAMRTSLRAEDLPDSLIDVRFGTEAAAGGVLASRRAGKMASLKEFNPVTKRLGLENALSALSRSTRLSQMAIRLCIWAHLAAATTLSNFALMKRRASG
jgi:hypothetical protein